MQNQTQRRPEQRIAGDLGLTLEELAAVVRHERAVRLSGRLAKLAGMIAEQAPLWPIDWDADAAERITNDARTLFAEIDAPIGGAS